MKRAPNGVSLALVVFLITAPVLPGQETASAPAAEPAKPQSAESEAPTGSSGGSIFESQTLLEILDRTFDPKSDSFNPEEGSMQWKGRTFNVGNSRLFRARFERYLNTPEGDLGRDLEYQEKLEEIFYMLSTGNREDPEANLNKAWEMLFDVAEYEADAGNSLVIANMVYNAWRVRDQNRANTVSRTLLERERRTRERIVASREGAIRQASSQERGTMIEELSPVPETGNAQPQTGNSSANAAPGPVTEAGFRVRDLATVEGRIQALQTHSAMTAQQVKLQFQSQILSFFFQRRFQHALISTSFYRMIFKASAQALEVGEKEMKDFMPDSDLVPSIETLDFLAREALADVGAGMSAVKSAYGEDRLVSALERLQETFFLGEHTAMVQNFEYEKRQTLLQLHQKMTEARKLLELKDYDQVEIFAEEIAALADDFRLTEALSGVRSIKQMSNLALFSAQQGIARGDTEKAAEGLARAAQMWPLNPALDSFTRELTSKVDVAGQASERFDRHYRQGQYRQIFEQRAELMPGVFGDELRSEQMRAVIDSVGRINMLVAQSREMAAQQNGFAAWEMLVAASEIDANDVVVNREKAELAPSVAGFVGALDDALRQEDEGAYAVSLSRFLQVRALYPASRLARQGIERVGEKLMDQIAGDETRR